MDKDAQVVTVGIIHYGTEYEPTTYEPVYHMGLKVYEALKKAMSTK